MKEVDIETAFIEFLESEKSWKVIDRQVRLPFGIIDILAFAQDTASAHPIVVEIKKGIIDERACAQLIGYIGQINWFIYSQLPRSLPNSDWDNNAFQPVGILVGSDINERASRVVKSTPILFYKYSLGNGKIVFDWQEQGFELYSFDNNRLDEAIKKVVELTHIKFKGLVVREAQFRNSVDAVNEPN